MSDFSLLSSKAQGYTLVEIAMVLVIVGLMLGGLLMPLSAQMDQRNVNKAKRQVDEIKEAIMGYALATGKLPCPAASNIVSNGIGAGVADCTLVIGVVPWTTLGVRETDPWGRRFTYRVTVSFTDSISSATYGAACNPVTSPVYSSFALCSTGDIDILPISTGGNVALNVPTVVISHGKNGAGAYLRNGTQLPASNDPDEKENSDADRNFVDHIMTPGYDDIISWVSGAILLNRMVAAGKLP